jgi:hypothetical protein
VWKKKFALTTLFKFMCLLMAKLSRKYIKNLENYTCPRVT